MNKEKAFKISDILLTLLEQTEDTVGDDGGWFWCRGLGKKNYGIRNWKWPWCSPGLIFTWELPGFGGHTPSYCMPQTLGTIGSFYIQGSLILRIMRKLCQVSWDQYLFSMFDNQKKIRNIAEYLFLKALIKFISNWSLSPCNLERYSWHTYIFFSMYPSLYLWLLHIFRSQV